ncbi:hypothetical protein K491DRAFT_687180 [Lophiostoma macrostomum CBS 122681]|uniref:Uncharacterized protein n=1 Tax=Lophiostoma macrostomum CBS 122681 TaxID=1314788 RepID=A0A6A6TPR7_9PLEO|nr:hypothetical protein K491DRAFT_687180 [Lophiostoma macrostomum CBS 122681]
MVHTKIFEDHFPHPRIPHTSSYTNLASKPTSKSGTSSPTTPKRLQPTRASSHPGPAPKSKPPNRAFGTNYRVRRSPLQTPANQHPVHGQPLQSQDAHSSIHDFAKTPSAAAHTQPHRRKPVYSMHEADPAVKGRPETIYTEEEVLNRLNTIGEDNEDEAQRVRTVDKQNADAWEEKRRQKVEKDMEEWDRKEAKKGPKMIRTFSWKNMKNLLG